MEEYGDVDVKHERPNPYGPPPPNPIHRMPAAETPTLHSYHPPPGASMPPPGPAWNPTPSPYSESSEHRPHPSEIAHQQPYPPHSQPPYPGPPARAENPAYPPPPDPGYGRPGSVSGPTRSPAEPQHAPYHHPVSNPHEPPYYPPTPADYRPRHAYSAPESQPNGTHQQPLHVVTGHEMMPGQPPSQPGPYGPHSAGPPPSTPYFYPDYGAGQRRKPVRAAQACDSCRQRKAKCDEGRPECQHCKENGLKCSYREIPPQKSEKQVLAITAQLDSLAESVKVLADTQRAQGEKFDLMFNALQRLQPETMTAQDATRLDERRDSVMRSQTRMTPTQSNEARRESSSEAKSMSHPMGQPAHQLVKSVNTGSEKDGPNKHPISAQYLLLWPPIQALIPAGISPTYVMDLEVGRGLLRLYGCGEGEDKGDGHEGAPSPAGSSSSDETSSSPYGVWGVGQLHAPQGLATQSYSAREHPGGVSPHGGLMLDSDAVDVLPKLYGQHTYPTSVP